MDKPLSEVAYATRVLHLPVIGDLAEQLADQARSEHWSCEEYLAALLGRQLASREAHGATTRLRRAHFPRTCTLEDFNFDYQPSAPRDLIAHLATGPFVTKADNVIFLGPPGVGKTHLAIALGIKATQAGHSVVFKTALDWITDLRQAHAQGCLSERLDMINKTHLIIADELGYIPLDPDAASLFFQLVASRYETGSMIITTNLDFARWGEAFNDTTVAAAMIDRLVHHAEIIALKGDSYRTRNHRAHHQPDQPGYTETT